jgi:hypothetical protein
MPGKPPYYESRFVRANHPDRAMALWLRETLLLPTVGESVADVWVMIFDPEGAGNRALKVGHPMEVADYRYGNGVSAWTAQIATFDGRVELDAARLDLEQWTGSVNHNWGRHHTPAYAFGQVCGFDDAPGSSLEIVTARAAVGPVSLPAVTLFVLRYGAREFAVRSILAARHTRGEYRPFS